MTIDAHDSRLFPVVGALVAGAWYAMPDVIRSRAARTALKAVLLGVTGAGTVIAADAHREQLSEVVEEVKQAENGPLIAVAAIAVSAVITVVGEKAIYRNGERRRARGRRFAHSLPALVIAGLTAVASLPLGDESAASQQAS